MLNKVIAEQASVPSDENEASITRDYTLSLWPWHTPACSPPVHAQGEDGALRRLYNPVTTPCLLHTSLLFQ